MILSLALGFAIVTSGQDAKPVVCPMTAEEVSVPFASIDFAGTRYSMCCGGCPDGFKKDPAAALKSDKLKGKTVGIFLFDPVSNKRIEPKNAAGGSSDYKGTRYLFATADEKAKFEANPKDFVKQKPTKEVLYCVVAGEAIKNYASAGGYVDIGTTRYYTCCANCLAKLKADPATYSAKGADHTKDPAAIDAPKAQ
ncbi:MAG: YHS domain-containing protein [Fimbriimonas sp.]|nr:YHS domain-containing protein [Fimbriimonas sp.]